MTAYKQSVGGEPEKSFMRIFLTEHDIAWGAVLEALKSHALDVSNREAGFIQTRWKENTADRNFIDSFGAADSYLKAQYRVRVTVAKGFHEGEKSVKVTVIREQLVQRDVLEGWKPVTTDSIEENTLLYRIGRIIVMRTRLGEIEKDRVEQEMEQPVEF